MGSDQFIEMLSQVSSKLIPVAVLILIIFLIVCVKNVIESLKTLNKTLTTTEAQVKKLDRPLQTVGDISDTVDRFHIKTRDTIDAGLDAAKEGFSAVKEKAKGVKVKPRHAKSTSDQTTVEVEEVIINEE
ncbi:MULTISPECIES: hypothetical protein [Breznakia]|uniref:DUF948 domain-containing protein n=1 Tax=Breznakia blatticola TaxID=1754012 RepID=A0A4R8AAU3_9FIRM|nr:MULTISPECIES: hypothetical protein [Breznakia]MDH6366320.1 uncharacterized protein YoxC [Breznakia sp. PH1-1]MDH6403413.1 uncharacterized protein YoxC [Breznakia sp. PF1-11]MDH6411122.1 uncharacterized protein YoxC [Breznakia sp. PFB1-11]MDH6413615.1 uncharacterized protein YoxC [Breznakia sp. PFB1-14]MDH6415667.1 uncharacterized protein YoxC [Breznakia sp. PFB1-4]